MKKNSVFTTQRHNTVSASVAQCRLKHKGKKMMLIQELSMIISFGSISGVLLRQPWWLRCVWVPPAGGHGGQRRRNSEHRDRLHFQQGYTCLLPTASHDLIPFNWKFCNGIYYSRRLLLKSLWMKRKWQISGLWPLSAPQTVYMWIL